LICYFIFKTFFWQLQRGKTIEIQKKNTFYSIRFSFLVKLAPIQKIIFLVFQLKLDSHVINYSAEEFLSSSTSQNEMANNIDFFIYFSPQVLLLLHFFLSLFYFFIQSV